MRKTIRPDFVKLTVGDVPSEYKDLFRALCSSAAYINNTPSEVMSAIILKGAIDAFGQKATERRLESYIRYHNRINEQIKSHNEP